MMCRKIYREDLNILKMFINEWLVFSYELEKEIVKLEFQSQNTLTVMNLSECIHSIKGGSSFIGLSEITRISHEIEMILVAIKDGHVVVNTELIDSMLFFVDFLKAYVAKLNGVIQEYDDKKEDCEKYFEMQDDQKEELVFHKIKLALYNSQTKEHEDYNVQEPIAEENTDMDVLQSDDFKIKLAEGIKEQFQQENLDHIDKIENNLLIRLDTNNDDKEAVNEIFRAVHSIKGGTGIYLAVIIQQSTLHMELKKFADVVHTFESLLTLIRDKDCKFEKQFIDLSLLVLDYFKSFIESVDSEVFHNLKNQDIINKIMEQSDNLQGLEDKSPTPSKPDKQKNDEIKSNSTIAQSIRVNQEKLDKMMNTISELVIAKNSFMHISTKLNLEYDLPEISKEVKQVGSYVNRISDELQNAIMSIRMVEVKNVFQKMPRVIRDIALSTGKKMELTMQGENTEIDKTIVEQISDPLVHLIRNSADHGIESAEVRLEKGKPETGSIVLRAYNHNKHVYIEIEDDGKGIDPELLKTKAIEKGLISEIDAEKMSQKQLMNLVFLPGFSMAKKVTEVSGRGVGMDIVKSNIAKINGKITIESDVDKGTKMVIQLPITLAVSRGLIVEVSKQTYIFPLEHIVETVKIRTSDIHQFKSKCFTNLRGETIGVEWLSKIFLMGEREENVEELNAIILSDGVENYAIVVDKLKNEQEFVVKTLEGHLASIPGISGSTLLGNGQVVLIVNPTDLLQLVEK